MTKPRFMLDDEGLNPLMTLEWRRTDLAKAQEKLSELEQVLLFVVLSDNDQAKVADLRERVFAQAATIHAAGQAVEEATAEVKAGAS